MSGSRINQRQEAAIAALLTERTHAEAAKLAGISVPTLRRWLALPAFRRAFRRAKERLVDDALERLELASGEAVEALRRNVKCGDNNVEVRAALGILGQVLRVKDIREMEKRLKEVEKLFRQSTGHVKGENECNNPSTMPLSNS
jgi:hypothetical protein